MIKRVYDCQNKEPELIMEEHFDEKGDLFQRIEYSMTPEITTHYEHDAQHRIIKQREIQGDIELNSEEFEYNENGDTTSRKLFIADSLYEEVKTDFEENGSFIRTTLRDGMEVEKMVGENDGETFTNHFYVEGELVETQERKHDPETGHNVKVARHPDGRLAVRIVEEFDEQGLLVRLEERNDKDSLQLLYEVEYQGDLVVLEKRRIHQPAEVLYDIFHEYDENQNETKIEVKTPSGKLLEYRHAYYDDQNRLVEEQGYKVGYFDGISGISANRNEFHHMFTYDKEL